MSDLLRCPFCGATPEVKPAWSVGVEWRDMAWHPVNDCPLSRMKFELAAWNRRSLAAAAPPTAPALPAGHDPGAASLSVSDKFDLWLNEHWPNSTPESVGQMFKAFCAGAASPAAPPAEPVAWRDVVKAIAIAEGDNARRGSMYPQVAEEHREDARAAARTIKTLEFLGDHCYQLEGWPTYAALASPAPGSVPAGWRSIESAPRDGRWILLNEPGCMTVGRWWSNYQFWWDGQCESDGTRVPVRATHWQPLPEPPSAAALRGAAAQEGGEGPCR